MFNIKLNHFKKKSLKIMSSAHNKKPVTAPLMHVKGRTSDGSSQCTCIWETDMWCIVFSTQCTWVCSCSCYLQSLALFMPLPHVLFRVLVLKQSPSLIAKCQVELSAMLFFPATHISTLSLKLSFNVPWTNSPFNLFSVMTLQLIMWQLPGYRDIICPLHLSCPHAWAKCILFNI